MTKTNGKTHTCARCKRTGKVADLFGTRTMPTLAEPDRRIPQPWCKKCRALAAKASREGGKVPPVEPSDIEVPESYEEVLAMCKERKIPLYASRKRRPISDLRDDLREAMTA